MRIFIQMLLCVAMCSHSLFSMEHPDLETLKEYKNKHFPNVKINVFKKNESANNFIAIIQLMDINKENYEGLEKCKLFCIDAEGLSEKSECKWRNYKDIKEGFNSWFLETMHSAFKMLGYAFSGFTFFTSYKCWNADYCQLPREQSLLIMTSSMTIINLMTALCFKKLLYLDHDAVDTEIARKISQQLDQKKSIVVLIDADRFQKFSKIIKKDFKLVKVSLPHAEVSRNVTKVKQNLKQPVNNSHCEEKIDYQNIINQQKDKKERVDSQVVIEQEKEDKKEKLKSLKRQQDREMLEKEWAAQDEKRKKEQLKEIELHKRKYKNYRYKK